MAPLLEEPDRTEQVDVWLRGFFAGVVIACLAFLVVGGSVLLGVVR